jgi:hypothetical protein
VKINGLQTAELVGGRRARHLRRMSLTLTLFLLAGAVAAMIFAGWRGARPPHPLKGPRMVPWRFLMLGAAALAFLLLVHVGTLMGVQRPG